MARMAWFVWFLLNSAFSNLGCVMIGLNSCRHGELVRSRLFGKDVFAGGRVGERGGWGGGDLHFDLVAGLTGQPSSNTFYILHPQDI